MRPWLIYTRVSTEEQAREGVSLDVQLSACRAVLQAKGHTHIEHIADPGASAKDTNRPGMREVLARLERGELAGICIWKLDRLTRRLRDLLDIVETLQQHDTELMSIQESIDTSGPIGRFTLSLMGALAQLEREQIGERVSAARAHLTAHGFWAGGPIPYGCRTRQAEGGRILERDPVTAPHIECLWPRVVEGASLGDLVEYLHHSPVAHKGRGWSKMAVRNLLRRDCVVGLLVDQETWQRAQDALAGRACPGRPGQPAASRSARTWPLRERLQCGACGATLVGVTGGKGHPYLRCTGRIRHGRSHCEAKDLPAVTVERATAEGLRQILTEDDGLLDQLATELTEADSTADDQRVIELTRHRDRIATHRGHLLDLLTTASPASARALDQRLAELQTDLETAEQDLARAQAIAQATAQTRHSHAAQLLAIRELVSDLPDLPDELQATTYDALVESVTLTPTSLDYTLTPGLKTRRPPPSEGGRRFVQTSSMLPGMDAIRTHRRVPIRRGIGPNRRLVIELGGNVAADVTEARRWPLRRLQDQLQVSQSTASRIRRGLVDDVALARYLQACAENTPRPADLPIQAQ